MQYSLDFGYAQEAWAAGFFDGEGCVAICKQVHKKGYRTSYMLQLSISQKDPQPLHIFRELFGGFLYEYSAKQNRVKYWRWSVHGNGALSCLDRLIPFLVLKKERAEIGSDYQRKLVVWNRDFGRRGYPEPVHKEREEFYLRMRMLNQRSITEVNPEPKKPGPRPGHANSHFRPKKAPETTEKENQTIN
jgi:hypothetical protein